MIQLVIAEDFSKAPAGQEDGRRFRLHWLHPMFLRAVVTGEKLLVDLDGCCGYATSFLREAFGGLAQQYTPGKVLEVLAFKTEEEPYLEDDIRSYIREAETP